MEEPKAPEASAAAPEPKASNSSAASTAIPSSTTSIPPTTKKRPLESDDSHSNYFKIRAVVRDLRPHVIQVLQTPDYKNCKASQEIREQLKIVIKLYDSMKADAVSLGKIKSEQQEQQLQHVKSPEQIQVEKAYARSSENKVTAAPASGNQKLQAEDGQGTYVVGGSAFGWNFITFSGKDAVYYGRTKEQFRSTQLTQSPSMAQ